MKLIEKLVEARERRGWTVNGAAQRTGGVHHHALSKLESGESDPAKLRVATVIELWLLYWPDLKLSDFLPAELGRVVRLQRQNVRRPKKEIASNAERRRKKNRKDAEGEV